MSDSEELHAGIAAVRAAMSNLQPVDLPDDWPVGHDGGADFAPPDYTDEPPPVPPGDQPDAAPDDEPPAKRCAILPLNDYGNGRRVVIHFGDDIRFVAQVGWFFWDGRRWCKDDEITKDMAPRVRAMVHSLGSLIEAEVEYLPKNAREERQIDNRRFQRRQMAELERVKADQQDDAWKDQVAAVQRELARIENDLKAHTTRVGQRLTFAKNAGNSRTMSNALNEARVMLAREIRDMDRGALDMNTLSGVLRFSRIPGDPENGMSPMSDVELLEHHRDQLLTKLMPVEYDPAASCPKFDAFLSRIQPSAEMRGFLQRWFGASMTGESIQRLAFFYGNGANGKSVLVDLMARLAGEYSATARIETLTGSNRRDGSSATPDLMLLIGARFVRASEPEEGERLQEALIKALTSGEPMMVRGLHADFIQFDPTFKLTISGNHKPEIRGTDDGIWRRVMLVPFNVQIPEAERIPKEEMDAMLWAERSGILNWLVDGLLSYLAGGLQVPQSVTDATSDFRRGSDPVGAFLTECTAVTGYSHDFMPSKDLIDAFSYWLEEDRGETAWGRRTVSNRLADKAEKWRHPDSGKSFIPGKNGVTGYRGIALAEEFKHRMAVGIEKGWRAK